MTVILHHSAQAFLARAESFLVEREAAYNLIYGIARRLQQVEGGQSAEDSPVFLTTHDPTGAVTACSMRTPPFGPVISGAPIAAAAALADAFGGMTDALPTIHGPLSAAQSFADRWGALKGVTPSLHRRMHIYRLDRVDPPPTSPPGKLRLAVAADSPLVHDWAARFWTEIDERARPPISSLDESLVQGQIVLWESDSVVSMAARARRTPNGCGVNLVYTPVSQRGCGYATALVAGLSQRILDEGFSFCFLYTDAANPTSNSIYAKIGYRHVDDAVVIGLGEPP